MSYIGNTQQNQNYVPAIDYFNGDGSTTAFTLSRPVASVAAVQAVISNVPQNPGSAFTVSGSTITFTSAPPSGTNNIYVYYTSPNTQIVQPGQGTVGATQVDGNYALWNKSGSDINYTAGNVGIGTNSPSQKVDAATSNGVNCYLSATSGSVQALYGASTGGFGNVGAMGTLGNYPQIFITNSAERMRIDSSGNLLVGTSTAGGSVANAIVNKVNGVNVVTYMQSWTTNPSSSTTLSIDPSTLFGASNTSFFHIEVDAGCYGNAGSGPGVYKAVLGGYSNSDGNFSISTISNSMTAGTWTALSNSGTAFFIVCNNTNATYTKSGVVRWTITWA